MNRITFTALLIVVALVSMAIPAPAQTMSTIQKGAPLNSGETPMTGYVGLSTPTITWSAASVAVRIPALPAGTVQVVAISSGSVNYGDSTVKDDAVGAYPTLADEAEKIFNIYPNTPQPDIWFVPTASGATGVVVRFIPIVQR